MTFSLFPVKAPKQERSEQTEQFKAPNEGCVCGDELPASLCARLFDSMRLSEVGTDVEG